MQLKKVTTYLTEEGRPYLSEETIKYKFDNRKSFDRPAYVYDFAQEMRITEQGFESVYAFFTNARLQVLSCSELAKGGFTQSLIPFREIIQTALLTGASHILLLHNHPSGGCTPSSYDITMTNGLYEAVKLCGLELIDHIIASREGYYSFHEEGILPSEPIPPFEQKTK